MKTVTELLGELCNIVQGAYLKKHPHEEGVFAPVIRIQNLTGLELGGEFFQEELAADKASRFRVHAGQIVVTLRGLPLKASVVGQAHAGAVVNSNFAVLTIRNVEVLDPLFLAGLLRSEVFNQRLRPWFAGTTISSLTVSHLKKIEVPLVPKEIQQQWGQVFRALEQYQLAASELVRMRTQEVEAYLGQLVRGGLL